MAKISTYAISTPVVDDDKWIGTDASALKETKNFTARDVAEYLNDFDKVESDSLRYEYQNWETGDVRKAGSISFSTSNAGSVAFSTITAFMLSKYTKALVDVNSFYTNPLVNSQVLISQSKNTSIFGIYTWNSAVQNGAEINFWDIGVTYVTGNGSLETNEDYFISLLQYNVSASGGDKNYTEVFGAPLTTWTVNHNLNKKPAVSCIDTSGNEVYGLVDYINNNQVTITFSAATGGTVTCN
tara:strand:- start:1300 stop:2022 length:723 start_codon:yes stop_codon:yes gene_type:complete